jgi:hypothetical protein
MSLLGQRFAAPTVISTTERPTTKRLEPYAGQTVLFLGYGDERALDERTDRLARAGRELFLKVSYAFQR